MINNNKETEVRNTIRDVDNKQSHLPTWQHSNIKKTKKKQKKHKNKKTIITQYQMKPRPSTRHRIRVINCLSDWKNHCDAYTS
jgi:hypothetical protein